MRPLRVSGPFSGTGLAQGAGGGFWEGRGGGRKRATGLHGRREAECRPGRGVGTAAEAAARESLRLCREASSSPSKRRGAGGDPRLWHSVGSVTGLGDGSLQVRQEDSSLEKPAANDGGLPCGPAQGSVQRDG